MTDIDDIRIIYISVNQHDMHFMYSVKLVLNKLLFGILWLFIYNL